MNVFTKQEQFIESAQFILDNSKLLIKSDCKIVNDVLYEKLGKSEYRFFFSVDDYDYLENQAMIDKLNILFV